MLIKKNKKFPKLKKSLKKFLTDESGKITKKDALGISAVAVLVAWVEDSFAGSSYTTNISPISTFYPTNGETYRSPNHTNSVTKELVINWPATCNHASGIVNGHFSSTPIASSSAETFDVTKTHSSHSSHWSGWWC